MFAKLYGTGDDQVLVKLDDDNEEGQPEVRYYFKPKGLGVCSLAIGFKNTDEGWEAAEHTFDMTTEERARSIIGKTKSMLETNNEEDDDSTD